MNVRRVAAVAALEGRATLANPLIWGLVVGAAFAVVAINPAAMIPSGDAAVAGTQPFANSRHALAQVFALTGLLFYTLPISILAGRSRERNDEARITELLQATPLTAAESTVGHFLGLLLALGTVLAVHVALAIGWGEGGALVGSTRVHGPFAWGHYLGPALIFLGPGVLFTAGLAFAVSAWTRSSLAVYAVATVSFVVAIGALGRHTQGVPWLDSLAVLCDPWGARWLSRTVFGLDRGVAFYNQAPLPFDGAFVLNRLIFLGLPLLALAATVCPRRRFVVLERGAQPTSTLPDRAFAPLSDLAMTIQPPSFLRVTWAVARAELAQLRSSPGPYLFGLFVVALVVEAAGSARGVYDSPVILTAGGLAVSMIEGVTGLGCLLLLFQLIDSLDRARRLGLYDLLATAPVSTAALMAGVQLAAALLWAAVLTLATAAGLTLLGLQPQGRVSVTPFLLVWGVLLAPTFLAWGAFVSALYGLTGSRSRTHGLGLAALAATAAALFTGRLTWVTNWPLWGALRWSDLGAFELHGEPLVWNRLVVLALALGLAVLAVQVFPRRAGTRPSLGSGRLLALGLLVAIPAAVLAVRVHQGFEGGRERARDHEYWRRNVEIWSASRSPTVSHLEARLELLPAAGAVLVDGRFTLVNDGADDLSQVPFTVGAGFGAVDWRLDGAEVSVEDRSGLHVLRSPQPIGPGRSYTVGFRYRAEVPLGFSRNGGEVAQFIRPSGVVLDTLEPSFLPAPGFVVGRGVDRFNRTEPASAPADFWRAELPPVAGGASFTTRLEITAPEGLTVNAVGRKTAEHSAGAERTTAVWEARHPVGFVSVVAGRWAVVRRGPVAVFHHPGHGANVPEILAALEAAHRHYGEWFGPYPWPELNLSEHPDHITRAKGFPTQIPFSEGMGFLSRSDSVPGLPTLVTAHEAAHQWWAHRVMPGRGPGADLLLEGLAHYSTLLLLEAEHGDAARRDFARTLEARYADRRRVDGERPLVEILDTRRPSDESATYDKGAWVLWMLDRQLGRPCSRDCSVS